MAKMSPQKHPPLMLSLRFACRELRSGFSGFTGFLFCLALGVGGIGMVGSFSEAIRSGLVEEGQFLLGGDIEFALAHRQVDKAERQGLEARGEVSEIATLRAIITAPSKNTQSLIEIKAIDDAYPLYGKLHLIEQKKPLNTPVSAAGLPTISVEETLLARLKIEVGAEVKIGKQNFVVAETIKREPDRISSGFMIGPRVFMPLAGLDRTGLVQPGSLIRWRYRIRLPDAVFVDIDDTTAAIKQKFPDAGWRIRTRNNAAPGIGRYLDRLTVFLTLVGFTTLLVGGVGIANAVKGYIDAKRSVIATYKCLGATGAFISQVYLLQIMMIAFVGIAIGVVAGAVLPLITLYFLADILPVPATAGIFIQPLAISALFGLLTAFAFAMWPLGRVRSITAAALYRDLVTTAKQTLNIKSFLLFVVSCLALCLLLIVTSVNWVVSAWFVVGAAMGFAMLGVVSVALIAAAKRLPRFKSLELRLAISNLHRPGAATTSAIMSLGLGLTLLVTLMLIDKNLVQQLNKELPDLAPSFFFVDIQQQQMDRFQSVITATADVGTFTKVPMLRGRIVKLKNVDVEKLDPPAGARWVLRGDRGITYSQVLPKGSSLVTGKWWDQKYSGTPLVSFTHDLAELLGLSIGDTITVNVLGRNITAKIANTRAVEWRSFGINFVMVFSPHTLKGAPHSYLSTVSLPQSGELKLLEVISTQFSNVTSIRVRDVLGAINALLEKLTMAIRAASSLSFSAAIVVLAGAIATGRRVRTYDAVVLKTLGATRKVLLWSYCLEYGILGLFSGIFALLAGTLGAYLIVEYVLDVRFQFFPGMAVVVTVLAGVGTVVVGLISSWRILAAKPAAILRSQI